MAKTEKMTFEAHPAIVFQAINSQSGSLHKALCELVINSADAGATFCDIKLDSRGFSVRDDGRGFNGRYEIDNFFKTFGTPHEEGDATWGRFRLGRGQIMAWGSTHWKTTHFEMQVDVKTRGLEFDLIEHPEAIHPGCSIEGKLYTPLSMRDLDSCVRSLGDLVAYIELPVRINGKAVTKDRKAIAWDVDNDDALIKFTNSGGVSVYNMGMFVCSYPAHKFGMNAVVVSKPALTLCTARNEVLESGCEVFKRIRKELGKHVTKDRAERLNNEKRSYMIAQFIGGELSYNDIRSVKLLKLSNGRFVSLSQAGYVLWSDAPDGDRVADRAMVAKRGLVASPWTLEQFGVQNAGEMLDVLRKVTANSIWRHQFERTRAVSLQELSGGISDACRPVAERDTTKLERALLSGANAALGVLTDEMVKQYVDQHEGVSIWAARKEILIRFRQVVLGESETCEAWTDGSSRITYDRDRLMEAFKLGLKGCIKVVTVLVHECCHDIDDTGSHTHDFDFYEKYHEVMAGFGEHVGAAAVRMMVTIVNKCRVEKIKVPGAFARDAERIHDAMLAQAEKVEEVAEPEDAAAE